MKYIINVDKYIYKCKNNKIVIAKVVKEEDLSILEKIGFSSPLTFNESITPRASYNKLTLENVNGKEIIRKDLPRDEEYVQSVHWKRIDWGGYEHEGDNLVTRFRYRREYSSAFNEKLNLIKNSEGETIICSNPFLTEDKQRIKFVINLFLSIFGEFEVLDETLKFQKIEKKNFTFLRPGELTKEQLKTIIGNNRKKSNSAENTLILQRFEFLNKFNELDTIMVGNQGFYGYYAIKTKNFWVVECNFINNATYLFDDKWEEYVKLTKQEVINGNLCLKRVYHNQNWEKEMSTLLK